MIYKDIVNILKDILSRCEGVNFVRYSGDDLNNQQQNHKPLQCYIDDVSLHQLVITQNILKADWSIYFLGHPEHQTPDEILDIQDKCYNLALNVLAYIDNKEEYQGLLRVYDFSILTLSRYTAQANAGVRLNVTLDIPNGVDLCNIDNVIGDEPYPEPEDPEIDVPTREDEEITIRKIRLPKNPC